MRRYSLISILSVCLFCSVVNAGFVEGTFWCEFPDDPCQTSHTWNFDCDLCFLTLEEVMDHTHDDSVVMSGETDSDPTFHIQKTITNDSDVAWTSFELSLGSCNPSDVATFDITTAPYTNIFGSYNLTDGDTVLTFYASDVVEPNDVLIMDFDVNVDTTGMFSFCLTQNPIPEPATLMLVSLGAVLFRRRK